MSLGSPIDTKDLVKKARCKSEIRGTLEQPGDYWDRSAYFLDSIDGCLLNILTHKQRQWYLSLKIDLNGGFD